jgi:hypothetical protein
MNSYKSSVYAFALYFVVICGGCVPNPNPNNESKDKFNEVQSITVELAWSAEYDSSPFTSLFNFLVPNVFAVLPPDYQPHYHLHLVFDHNSKTITDTYKYFTGMNSSAMTTSTKVRGSDVYDQISQYMEGIYLCEVKARENNGWVGPRQPVINIDFYEKITSGVLFADNPLAMTGDTKLCSEEFGNYLLSLMDDRR